ncbi:MAG: oligosaccharide flippase family protein [Bacteroidota bacterium]|jgi:O-antigen/teichoic acid export membrane protein
MIRKIIQHTFFYSFANQIPALVNLFLLPIVTPFLSSEDYATYGLILAYVGVLGAFSSLGYVVLFQNSFFHMGEAFRSKWSRLLGFQWVYKIIYAAIITSLLSLFLKSHTHSTQELFVVLFLVVIPLLFFDLTKSIGIRLCQFRNDHKKVYFISICTALVATILTLIGILYFQLGYKAWLISAAVSGGVQALYFGYILYVKEGIRPSLIWSKKEILEDLKTALPLVPKEYATYVLSSSDRVLLDQLHVSNQQIGNYNIAYSFASYFDNIQMQANQVITPILFRKFKEGNSVDFIRGLTHIWFFVSIFLATLVGLWIPVLFPFLYRNPTLIDSAPFAVLLFFTFCYRPLYVAAVDFSIFNKKTLPILWITLIAAAMNLILNVVLIPHIGAWASVWATCISYLSLPILGFYLIQENFEMRKKIMPIALVLVTVLSALGCYALFHVNLIERMSITAALLVLTFFMYWYKIRVFLQLMNHE